MQTDTQTYRHTGPFALRGLRSKVVGLGLHNKCETRMLVCFKKMQLVDSKLVEHWRRLISDSEQIVCVSRVFQRREAWQVTAGIQDDSADRTGKVRRWWLVQLTPPLLSRGPDSIIIMPMPYGRGHKAKVRSVVCLSVCLSRFLILSNSPGGSIKCFKCIR